MVWLYFLLAAYGLCIQAAIVPPRYIHPQVPLDSNKRLSSFPYISGDTFRSLAQFFFDETKVALDPSAVKTGDIIFVNANYLDVFFANVHPSIKSSYILISHNSIHGAPGKWESYLNDPTLALWFAKNVTHPKHPKMRPLPIGLANQYWQHGNYCAVQKIRDTLPIEKKHLLYMNFANVTNPGVRDQVFAYFAQQPFCMVANQKPFVDYMYDLSQSYFVLSPEGAGIDSHRTWEALLVGAVPILKHSSIDILFDDLPVVFVQEWTDITQEWLEQTWQAMSSKTFNYEKLFAPYWIEQIQSAQKLLRQQ